jgi:hypothetical protein
MSLLCFAGKHAAHTGETWNQGLYFSSCRRCGCDMVRADRIWKPVPHGFKIVWRPVERPEQAGRKQVIRNLPMVIPQGAVEPLPATAPVPVRSHAARRPFGLVQLVFLGVELLAIYGADGIRKWRRNVAARRLQRHATVLLLAR